MFRPEHRLGSAIYRIAELVGACCLLLGSAAEAARFSTVVIDAGHGGQDKGAQRAGVRESRLTLQTAARLEKLLQKKGIKTVMTRRSDVFVSLDSRIAMANRQRSAIFVSIHFNADTSSRYRGVETFFYGPAGRRLAQSIQGRLASRLKTEDRGAKGRSLKVITGTACPAVLVECGFLSHPGERGRCSSAVYQQAAAQAICDGIMATR